MGRSVLYSDRAARAEYSGQLVVLSCALCVTGETLSRLHVLVSRNSAKLWVDVLLLVCCAQHSTVATADGQMFCKDHCL